MKQTVLILDFGGQYSHLIARRIRDAGVYCEIRPYERADEAIASLQPIGIVLTGGPSSVNDKNAPLPNKSLFECGVPILGICYGAQAIARVLGGAVSAAKKSEYGQTATRFDKNSALLGKISEGGITWMSHTDAVTALPNGFAVAAATDECAYAAFENVQKKIFAVQFHPEVQHTANGDKIIREFLFGICRALGDWSMDDYLTAAVEDAKNKIGDGRVLLALSGGVDSSVCAALLSRAVGKRLFCVFVDHGLMRKNEGDQIEAAFKDWDISLIRVDAEARFLKRLSGVLDPEQKRKIIGEEFIRVFEEEAKKVNADFLAQGTIYPDIIESGQGISAVIKSHHNVGGLPKNMDFKGIVEPLRLLFKDEVRVLGKKLGLAEYLVCRQPFPGPGLAVRIIGDVTKDKLELLRDADDIFRTEIKNAGLDGEIQQYFAVLTNMRSVGVMGDGRTYDYALALRAVTTTDFMTADFARIPYDVLSRACGRIVNEIKGISRIVYDVTTKPPATIEWE